MHITLGSRQSHLAQKQAYMVKKRLESLGHKVDLFLKPSMGDLDLDLDLSSTDEKGVFTQDFTNLLLEKKVDCVVHSWKDLPIDLGGKTEVVATLEREDSRDLFFIKKNSLKKDSWTLLTSSPRREYHLKEFFDFLYNESINFNFKAIRGNIPTRFKKFLEDSEADGFCVALAAVKRLVGDDSFNQDYPGVWEALLKETEWCVLPESFCPSAAAQGALALEVLSERKDLIEALSMINNEIDRKAVIDERSTLKAYGGGCHLAIGVQVYNTNYGSLKISSGQHENETFKTISFNSLWPYPKKIKESELWLSSLEAKSKRNQVELSLDSKKSRALLVTRKESFETIKDQDYDELFTSGLKTWKALFDQGKWVNGCLDSLGMKLYPKDVFEKGIEEHSWLTRVGVEGPKDFKTYSTYEVQTSVNESSFEGKEYFAWMSGELLIKSLKDHPELKEKVHFVGLGRSFEAVEALMKETGLVKGENLFPFYDTKQLKNDIVLDIVK